MLSVFNKLYIKNLDYMKNKTIYIHRGMIKKQSVRKNALHNKNIIKKEARLLKLCCSF